MLILEILRRYKDLEMVSVCKDQKDTRKNTLTNLLTQR